MKKLLVYSFFLPLVATAQDVVYQTKTYAFSNDDQRYEGLLREYKKGKKDYSNMVFLITKAKELNSTDLSERLTNDYIENYLVKLDEDNFFTSDNINFIRSNIRSSKSKAFYLFNEKSEKVDSIVGVNGAAKDVVLFVIAHESIDPILMDADNKGNLVDWNKVERIVSEKYDSKYIDQSILDAKIRWYGYKKSWTELCENLITRVQKYGPFGFFPERHWQFNDDAWTIFLRSNNKTHLAKALAWCDSAVKLCPFPNAQYLDTKANLLYKLGQIKNAVLLEEKAQSIGPIYEDIKENLIKMKVGIPTWPAN